MTDTWDPELSTDKDLVRLLIGDNSPPNDQFTDQAIIAMLAIHGSTYLTGAALADSLAAKWSSRVSISVDGLSVSNSDKAKAYRELASRLRVQALTSVAGGLGTPTVSGISIGDMEGVAADLDRIPSQIRQGQFDDPQQDVDAPGGGGPSPLTVP